MKHINTMSVSTLHKKTPAKLQISPDIHNPRRPSRSYPHLSPLTLTPYLSTLHFFRRFFAFSLAMSKKIANFARDFEHFAPKRS